MPKPTLAQICRYKFDNFMSKGGSSLFVILTVVFVLLLLLIGILRGVGELSGMESERGDQADEGVLREFYLTWLQMTDPGNMAQDIDSPWYYKLTAVLAGIAGIIMLSLLIGFITTALVEKMNQLRKGHSKVIEEGHTLILGWSEQRVAEIIRELVIANESEDSATIVILSETPKEEMDDWLKLVLGDTKTTRIVTRSGSPSSLVNLRVTSIETCKSAIVLASAKTDANHEERTRSDAKTIKTILALAMSRGRDNPLNIVAEFHELDHLGIVQPSCPHAITAADANSVLAKIIVQTSRSVGLSIAYNEIMSFDGCEMYFHQPDNGQWLGLTFGAAQFHFPDGVIMGIRRANGELLLNPDASTSLIDGDDVLILADDDSTIEFRHKPVATAREFPLKDGRLERAIETELIIGWNQKGPILVREYSDYVLTGSSIEIIIHEPSEATQTEIAQLEAEIENLTITLINADPLEADTLINAEPQRRDNIIILNRSDADTTAEQADANTILILLLLRQIFDKQPDGGVNTRLITEVMDSANQSIISDVGVRDFIISDRLISMLLAQFSEEPDIKRVYDDLFEEDGSEIYLKPASLYFENLPVEVSFADCMALAQKRTEVCLGIKLKASEEDPDANYGVKLIPEKNTRYHLNSDDCLVVLAEDDT